MKYKKKVILSIFIVLISFLQNSCSSKRISKKIIVASSGKIESLDRMDLCPQIVFDYVLRNQNTLEYSHQLHHNLNPENVSFLTSCLIPPTT